ncbi:MAG: ARMT1-like domain-containing protein [Methanosphaera sp.]|uniref:damage-control phosphatase ARMT1 family protein n=1 Tax=Methanosphaera sp. TaxID=2666342 RepID=UPI0025CCB54E|nr:ARMT1-like domain-containing protein [Methanosphaera sp.]MCI5867219.1 ARMT1-like domain-containing protein [Methanosphaera sp.]MDY3955619.1 ARMT1-like domain-containing protein [Methanosphaera sp.]
MKVNYECAPCMMRQASEAIEHALDDEDKRMQVTLKILEYLNENFKENVRSNKLGTDMHHEIMKLTDNNDPYKVLREMGNNVAEKLIPSMKKVLDDDPSFANYVQIAVVGNIIDFGALTQDTDMEAMIKQQLTQPPVINDIDKLDEALRNSQNILYLADNGGEIVFDKLLIEKIKQDYDVNITLALKENPILNDALLPDAQKLELDKYAKLITTGAASVGVVEDYISDELKELIDTSDIIISKGMGNYEGLTEMNIKTPVYFLLNTKCQVISDDVGVPLKSNVVIKRDLSDN